MKKKQNQHKTQASVVTIYCIKYGLHRLSCSHVTIAS
jgi:hypothetical protein